jgi:hypothetical protein
MDESSRKNLEVVKPYSAGRKEQGFSGAYP